MADFELKEGTSKADHFDLNFDNNCTVYGYSGDDTINIGVSYQHAKNNVVYGGNGNDYITTKEVGKFYGENDNDTLVIGASNAFVHGGDGDDNIIIKSSTNSIVYGGLGSDSISVQPLQGKVTSTIMDLTTEDTIFIDSSAKNFSYEIENGDMVFSDEDKNFKLTFYGINDPIQVATVRVLYFMGNIETTMGKLLGVETSPTINTTSITVDKESIEISNLSTITSTDIDNNITNTVNNYNIDKSITVNDNNNIADFGDNVSMKNDVFVNVDSGSLALKDSTTLSPINIDETINTGTSTTPIEQYSYSGGNATISAKGTSSVTSSYGDYEQVNFKTEFAGFDLDDSNLYIKSSSGTLTIQNVRGAIMTYGDANGNIIARSFVANDSGDVNRQLINDTYEVIIGANNRNNRIYAGNSGSSLWGGVGGADTLTGGAGVDTFVYTFDSGNDVLTNVGVEDIINLTSVSMSQIVSANVESSRIYATFTNGGSLEIRSSASIACKVGEDTTYVSNPSDGTWRVK